MSYRFTSGGLIGFGARPAILKPGLISGTYQTLARDYGNSQGLGITANTTAHTKGSYFELTAATTADAVGLLVVGHRASGNSRYLCDIALGGEGSEINMVENLIFYGTSQAICLNSYFIPMNIPAGSRISTRSQSSIGGVANLHVCCDLLMKDGSDGLSKIETWGANTGDTGGARVTPSGTANTKGAWAELIASTARDVTMVSFGMVQVVAGLSDTENLMEFGIGAEASETVLIPNIPSIAENATDILAGPGGYSLLPVDIPAGSRISARTQAANGGIPAGSNYDVVMYGYSP